MDGHKLQFDNQANKGSGPPKLQRIFTCLAHKIESSFEKPY